MWQHRKNTLESYRKRNFFLRVYLNPQHLLAMASNLLAMASNLLAMASRLLKSTSVLKWFMCVCVCTCAYPLSSCKTTAVVKRQQFQSIVSCNAALPNTQELVTSSSRLMSTRRQVVKGCLDSRCAMFVTLVTSAFLLVARSY